MSFTFDFNSCYRENLNKSDRSEGLVQEIKSILIHHTKEITHKQMVILSPKHKNEIMSNVGIFDKFPIEHATRGSEM
jgi:hypothetical protein